MDDNEQPEIEHRDPAHVDMLPGEHLEVEAHEPLAPAEAGLVDEPKPHLDEPAQKPDHQDAMDEVKATHSEAEHEHLETASHIVTIPDVASGNRTLLGAGTTMAAAWHDALRRLHLA